MLWRAGAACGGEWWRVGSSCQHGALFGNDPDAYCVFSCVFPHGLGCVWDWSVCCKVCQLVFGCSLVVPCPALGARSRVGMALHSVLLAVSAHCVLCSRVPGLEMNFPSKMGNGL